LFEKVLKGDLLYEDYRRGLMKYDTSIA